MDNCFDKLAKKKSTLYLQQFLNNKPFVYKGDAWSSKRSLTAGFQQNMYGACRTDGYRVGETCGTEKMRVRKKREIL